MIVPTVGTTVTTTQSGHAVPIAGRAAVGGPKLTYAD